MVPTIMSGRRRVSSTVFGARHPLFNDTNMHRGIKIFDTLSRCSTHFWPSHREYAVQSAPVPSVKY